jgi:hypothetical protein
VQRAVAVGIRSQINAARGRGFLSQWSEPMSWISC